MEPIWLLSLIWILLKLSCPGSLDRQWLPCLVVTGLNPDARQYFHPTLFRAPVEENALEQYRKQHQWKTHQVESLYDKIHIPMYAEYLKSYAVIEQLIPC